MVGLAQAILESFRSPPRLHAMVVHLPVALALLGLLVLAALALTRGRSGTLRWLALSVYLLGAAMGYAAYATGERAEDHLGDIGVQLSGPALAEFNQHTEMGEIVWLFLAGAAALTALTAVNRPRVRAAAMALALAAGITAAGWVFVTAHHGGALVYVHGVGVGSATPVIPNAR